MPKSGRRLGAVLLAAVPLLSCTVPAPLRSPAPVSAPASASAPAEIAAPAAPAAVPDAPVQRGIAHWWPVHWEDLPGFDADALQQAWPAMMAGCQRPTPAWTAVCAALSTTPPASADEARAFLRAHLQPWRVTAVDGGAEGLMTGYYEPELRARRERDATHRTPLYALPDVLRDRREPWLTRREMEALRSGQRDGQRDVQKMLAAHVIAWMADPLDALVLQIQGSGRLQITEPDGRVSLVRLGFAGHNGHPYRSVGRWLIDQRELPADGVSWPAIKAWARANPARVNEMLWVNPRVVFFREEPLLDPGAGPRGALGVPLTPGRSIAVDPRSVPFGSWVWIDTTEPLSSTPLRRLVTAQDTGNAITGAVRGDYFWGWGDHAEQQAGRMKQPLRLWVLWPLGAVPPP